MQRISIIIPAYNEEKRIENTLKEYSHFFNERANNKELDYEILVVINNTKDKTEEIVKKQIKANSRIRYLNFKQGGKGFAVIEGFKDALLRENDLVGFIDADMSTRPEAFYLLIEQVKNIDGAIASRYIKGAVIEPKPAFSRLIASRIFNILIRSLLFMPYRDTQCGAKLFKREPLRKIIPMLSLSQWAFDAELIYHLRKLGYVVREFPTKWSDKEYSHIYLAKAGPSMALSIMRLRLLNSPFYKTVRLYNKMYDFFKEKFE